VKVEDQYVGRLGCDAAQGVRFGIHRGDQLHIRQAADELRETRGQQGGILCQQHAQ
jgi:hypothetical protein